MKAMIGLVVLAFAAAAYAYVNHTHKVIKAIGSWQELVFVGVAGLFLLAGAKLPVPLPVRILIRAGAIVLLFITVKALGPHLYPHGAGS